MQHKIALFTPAETKNVERTPRATHHTGRAQTLAMIASRRPSSVDLLIVANGALTKSYDRESTEISQI